MIQRVVPCLSRFYSWLDRWWRSHLATSPTRLSSSSKVSLRSVWLLFVEQLLSCGWVVNVWSMHFFHELIPLLLWQISKDEFDRLVEHKVLHDIDPAKILLPTFEIPKKDGRVQFVSDIRMINKALSPKLSNLLIIHYRLRNQSTLHQAWHLDAVLHLRTGWGWTICTQLGNYQYNRIPMGVKQGIRNCFGHVRRRKKLISTTHDIGDFSMAWNELLYSIDKIQKLVQDKNISVNPLKSVSGESKETDWLVYWLTPEGLKPWREIDPVLLIQILPTVSKGIPNPNVRGGMAQKGFCCFAC
jgi:hypothetical protein